VRSPHLLSAFDEAVRSAFVFLEEQLRKAVNKESMIGTALANYAFNPEKGGLDKHLDHTPSEREGLCKLYSGAFKLFRNYTAAGVYCPIFELDYGRGCLTPRQ